MEAAKWRSALEGQGMDEILQQLTLKKVTVQRETGGVVVHFDTLVSVPEPIHQALKRRLATVTGASHVDIRFELKTQGPKLEKLPEDCEKRVRDMLCEAQPAMRTWLANAQIVVGEKSVDIRTDNAVAADMFQRRECAAMIRRELKTAYGIDVQVKLTLEKKDRESIGETVQLLNQQQRILEQDAKAAAQARREAKAAVKAEAAAQQEKSGGDNAQRFRRRKDENTVFGYVVTQNVIPIATINERSGLVAVEGKTLSCERVDTKSGKKQIVKFDLFDGTCAMTAKAFIPIDEEGNAAPEIKKGAWFRVQGNIAYDPFDKDLLIMADCINIIPPKPGRMDNAAEKRVELHAHTKMSLMDGLTEAAELVKTAHAWGHEALAITDHGVVQGFPEAFETAERLENFKLILGMEGYLFDTPKPFWDMDEDFSWSRPFVVFDVETTGLHPMRGDRLTEIGAVRIEDGKITDRFSTFVNPQRSIPPEIVELTHITDDMVREAPLAEPVLEAFFAFCKGAALVAHNAKFDTTCIKAECERAGRTYDKWPVVDTLAMARMMFPDQKNHKLATLVKQLKVPLNNHHRAVADAEATAQVMLRLIEMAQKAGASDMNAFCDVYGESAVGSKDYHVVLLVQNQTGLQNLYHMITEAHLKYFYRRPRIPRTLLNEYREGLLIGSACEAGDLFSAIVEGKSDAELMKIADFYDYLEIQPIGNNAFMLRNGDAATEEDLRNMNRKVVWLARQLNKPVVATCDVHFLNPEDEVYRRILFYGQKYSDAEQQPPLYFRTTEEMMAEFSYFDPQTQYDLVIGNPKKLAATCEKLRPFPNETYYPKLEGAEDIVRNTSLEMAKNLYGDPLPEIIQKRLDKELKSIIGNGYSALYVTAARLVEKSLSDGYLVGSRGSVGSSLVATYLGITEVNPLQPHYRCPQCRYSDFEIDTVKYRCGVDLPPAKCPKCGADMIAEGYDIPFEVFLGFKGDKVPDIDLNFSGVYQPVMHKYTEVLFGKGKTFRAGTIAGVADKTAFGYVNGYMTDTGRTANKAEMNRLINGIVGVKRTTGQHPAGIVVVPKEISVELFTPLQHPADDKESSVITTHFDFNSLHDRLLKLDILGHDDPTMVRMLQDITGKDPRSIPLNDPDVMSLFQSPKALGITPEDLDGCPTGTLGVPEFGTEFVRQMLLESKPENMADLLCVSGLSHGTDVWTGNAQVRFQDPDVTLADCICTREDIMGLMIRYGVDDKTAFDTMEAIRKGKGFKPYMLEAIEEHDMPQWFTDSCKKIKYLFPKGHAAAYVMMALRIAWFKVHIPKAYYAAYLTIRAIDAFDIAIMGGGREKVLAKLKEYKANRKDATAKDKDIQTVLEIVLEMNSRGIELDPISLENSHATNFLLTETGLLPPLCAISGMGTNAAQSIADARAECPFRTRQDLKERTRVNRTQFEAMEALGCLKDLPENDQISMF